MSWDIILVKERFEIRPDAAPPPPIGSAVDVRNAISTTHPAVDWSDPRWGVLQGSGWSVGFNLSDKEPLPDVTLHVRAMATPFQQSPGSASRTAGMHWTCQRLSSSTRQVHRRLDGRDSPRSATKL